MSEARLQTIGRAMPARMELRGEMSAKPQPAWLTEALTATVHGERGRVKAIALALGVSDRAVYDVADATQRRQLPAWWLPTLCREAGSFDVLDAIEQQCGRVAIQLPQAVAPEHADVVAHTGVVVQHFSEVLAAVGASLVDGHISRDEQQTITREIADVHAALASLQALVAQKAVCAA